MVENGCRAHGDLADRGNHGIKNTRRTAKRMLCVALSCVLVTGMAGCGDKKSAKAPELLEPISTNEAYRPVSYGDIGTIVIKTGTVVPTDYAYYYDSSATLSKVYVNVGDEVKKDDVLAETDTDSSTDDSSDTDSDSDDTGDDEDASADVNAHTHSINQKIYEQNQLELDWKIKACEEAGDEEGASQYKVEKAVNAENNRYDNLLYEYELKKAKASDDEDESKKESGTLKAAQNGHVTYAKSITAEDNSVGGGEAVVVVSDYNDPYIEITGESFKKSSYEIYNNMYAVVDGQRYDIQLYNYTNQEIAVAQSSGTLPYIRFKLKDVKDQSKVLKVGNSVALYFSTSDAKNVLTVANDSIYEENGQTFVYVKNSLNEKERREIEIGKKDSNYTEVVSGLKEGELVYYASDAVMPGNYTEYTVALDSYSDEGTVESSDIKVEDLNSISYTAPCDGRFTEFNLEKDQEIKKGDVLFVIDSGGGSAAVKEIDVQIQDENESYNSSMADYNEQIQDLTKQINDYKSGKVATSSDAENILYMAEQLTCQRNVVSYNKELLSYTHSNTMASLNKQKEKLNKNNDGSGKISVYAEQDGTVLSVDATSDAAVKEGASVVTIGGGGKKIIAFSLTEGTLAVNQEVTFASNSNEHEKVSGVCVGNSGDSSKVYITTDSEGEVHITKSGAADELKYYVKFDDESLYEKAKSYKIRYPKTSFENIVMVPTNMIYHETGKSNSNEYDYVWLVEDGELVKQYITIGQATKSKTIVLTGLSEGDVIAKETAGKASGSSKSDESSDTDDDSGYDDSGSGDGADDDSGSGGDDDGGDDDDSDDGSDGDGDAEDSGDIEE